jgi:hypothetical protein
MLRREVTDVSEAIYASIIRAICVGRGWIIKFHTQGNLVSLGSSVSTVSGYWLDDRAIEVRSPAEAKGFFF